MNMATHIPLTDEQSTEAAIRKAGKTAARITPADIDAAIFSKHFFTAAHGVEGAMARLELHQSFSDVDTLKGEQSPSLNLGLLTFCVLVLRNGFTVTGESACASPENFDAGIGRDIAFKNAREKVWLLEGYLLKQRLFEAPAPVASPYAPHQQRVIDEKAELDEKITKLNAFFGTAVFTGLVEEERERLASQARTMGEYSRILADRIAAFEQPTAR